MAGKVYELRFYSFNLKGRGVFKHQVDVEGGLWRLRTSMSKITGVWQTQLNGATEFVHIAEYEDVADLLRVRQELMTSSEYAQKSALVAEQFSTVENPLVILSPNTRLNTKFTSSDSAIYELQTMKNSSSPPTVGDKGILVGCFTCLYGPLNTEYRLIRYPDAQSAQATALERMTQKDELAGMVESRLMVPMQVSELK